MSLIAEDGTGRADAESYVSVAEAFTYHSNRGCDIWVSLTQAQQEQALRRATDYMLGEYRLRWLGRRVLITQALDWPRVGVVLEDFGGSQGRKGMGSYGLFQVPFTIVPVEVKNAACELALRASAGILADDLQRRTDQETVGPITVRYNQAAPQRVKYPAIDMILRVYLLGGGNASSLSLLRT